MDFHPKDVFVRLLRRHHIAGLGHVEWRVEMELASPVCDQQNFEGQERKIERTLMRDPEHDSRSRSKSKMIHEASSDGVIADGDLVDLVNSWKPFSHQDSCTQCGLGARRRCKSLSMPRDLEQWKMTGGGRNRLLRAFVVYR